MEEVYSPGGVLIVEIILSVAVTIMLVNSRITI